MAIDLDSLRTPTPQTAAELLGWRPAHGILSLYVHVDPGDRSAGWRTELRNGLAAVGRDDGPRDRDTQLALEATAHRLATDVADEARGGEPRGLFGFVEVARKPGEERWYAAQMPPRRTGVRFGRVAQVHPLLEVLDDGAALGVAIVSSERIRLLDWRLGRVEQLHDWELEYFGGDWRERKAQKPDPARGSATASAGRDQHHQRMEDTRERFAEETGRLAHAEAGKRDWRQLLVFGDERYTRQFAEGYGGEPEPRHVERADLISEPLPRIEGRIERLLPGLNRERERALIERIKEAAYAEARSALGVQETVQALAEGRVEHLVYDSERDYPADAVELPAEPGADGLPLVERMVELALGSGAAITPVEGASAAALSEQGGVAALLRY